MDRHGSDRLLTRRHLLRALGAGAVLGSATLRATAADTVTLPLGTRARLAVSQGHAHLQATGHPVLRE